jgi:hypothetical protein
VRESFADATVAIVLATDLMLRTVAARLRTSTSFCIG